MLEKENYSDSLLNYIWYTHLYEFQGRLKLRNLKYGFTLKHASVVLVISKIARIVEDKMLS